MIASRLLPAVAFALTLWASASEAARALQGLAQVGFDQRLGERLPAALRLTDADGEPITLGELWEGRPLVMLLGYYGCPNLCGIAFDGLLRGLAELPSRPARTTR